MSQVPPSMPPQQPYGVGPLQRPVQYMKPHRGTMILVFSILGWFVCIIFGILAWIWGKQDLQEMDAGVMDPSGRDSTNAGRIIGMISVILALCSLAIGLLIAIVALVLGGLAATHG